MNIYFIIKSRYFDNPDDLIVMSTEHCMSKVEDEFMAKAPGNVSDLERFMDEIPCFTAEKHGKKYRSDYPNGGTTK